MAYTRKRSIVFKQTAGTQVTTTISNGSKVSQVFPSSIVGKQETTSESNGNWRFRQRVVKDRKFLPYIPAKQRHIIAKLDYGNEFTTKRNFYLENMAATKWQSFNVRDLPGGVTDYDYSGPLVAKDSNVSPISSIWPVLTAPSEALIRTLGATAIARCIPTNPVSDAAVFLGELKNDGLPSIIGSSLFKEKALFFKNLGGEYLNVEFGWKPFISDIQKFAFAAHNSKRIIDQYVRDSGRGVRRTYRFPTATVQSSTTLSPSLPQPTLVTPYYKNSTTLSPVNKLHVETVDYWFSGCFTYHLSLGSSSEEKAVLHAQLARKLIGLELTPETLWELAPWSWAIDWAVNIGDILHNVSAFAQDGLVMRYGYMMAHSVVSDTYTIDKTAYQNRDIGPLSQTFGTEFKVRRKASPYGFGLSFDGFTTRQLAILAALGISRSGGYSRG